MSSNYFSDPDIVRQLLLAERYGVTPATASATTTMDQMLLGNGVVTPATTTTPTQVTLDEYLATLPKTQANSNSYTTTLPEIPSQQDLVAPVTASTTTAVTPTTDFILPESQYMDLSELDGSGVASSGVASSGSALLNENILEAEARDRELRKANEQQITAISAQEKFLSDQLQAKEDQEKDRAIFEEAMRKNQEDRDLLVEGLKQMAPKKDSLGVRLGKALAIGLGAFGSSLSGTPNTAYQIIRDGAESAARELANDRQKAYTLLGLNKEQREEFTKNYKDKRDFQQSIYGSIIQTNILKSKAAVEAASTPSEKAKANQVLALFQQEEARNNEKMAMQAASMLMKRREIESKQKEEERKEYGKGQSPKIVANMDDQTYKNLTSSMQQRVDAQSLYAAKMYQRYEDISKAVQLVEDTRLSPVERAKAKATAERLLTDMASVIREGINLGVPNAQDAKWMELLNNPTDIFNRAGIRELDTLVYQSLRDARTTIQSAGGDFNKTYIKNLSDLSAKAFGDK